jgi:hypothetical protein
MIEKLGQNRDKFLAYSNNLGTKDNVEFFHDPKECTTASDTNDIMKSCLYLIAVYANSATGDTISKYTLLANHDVSHI